MVVPLVAAGIMAGAAVAGAAANYQASENARKDRKEQLRRLEDIVNAIKDPSFDARYISPEDFSIVAFYKPEIAKYVAEKNPEVIKGLGPGAQEGMQARLDALQRYRNLADTGEDIQSKILRAQALRGAQIQNQGQQASIRSGFARRGLGGSGLEYASALLGQQGSNLGAQRSSESAAMDAYNTRLNALRESASLGGDIRNDALSLEAKNAAIINDYNRRLRGNLMDYENNRVNTMNDAQLKNNALSQKYADVNKAQRYDSLKGYQDMRNKQEQTKFQNSINKANIQAGIPSAWINETDKNLGNNRDMINSLVTGTNQAVTAYGQQSNSDRYYDYWKNRRNQDAVEPYAPTGNEPYNRPQSEYE